MVPGSMIKAEKYAEAFGQMQGRPAELLRAVLRIKSALHHN